MRLTTDQAKTIRSGILLGIGDGRFTRLLGLRFYEQRRRADLNNSPQVTETKPSRKAHGEERPDSVRECEPRLERAAVLLRPPAKSDSKA